VGCGAPGMHHPFRDALVIEVGDLLAQVKILEQRRAAVPGLQRMVGVRQAEPLSGGQVVAGLPPAPPGWMTLRVLAPRLGIRSDRLNVMKTQPSWAETGGDGLHLCLRAYMLAIEVSQRPATDAPCSRLAVPSSAGRSRGSGVQRASGSQPVPGGPGRVQ
jgi:hypothetical protein